MKSEAHPSDCFFGAQGVKVKEEFMMVLLMVILKGRDRTFDGDNKRREIEHSNRV